MAIISPSILSADFCNLEIDIKRVEPYVKWLHIDVMDGHFVPNITIGVPVVKSIKKCTNLFLDTHLMIENPQNYIEPFKNAGSDLITFHYEAVFDNTIDVIKKIKSYDIMAGLSIKPKTPVNAIKDYIKYADLILVMTVEPGFGGQKFMEDCAKKIKEIKEISPDILVQADGGINDKTAQICLEYGADSLVAGSYIYNAENIEEAIKNLKPLF
ncbi:MAG: ribulose-phosphate 3-epimerase [Candidatus Gastranaerophilales bacterium]|nr:ribulose-phosphate 3-epimerase [Candidatus Gastranaerophilales bacterium]